MFIIWIIIFYGLIELALRFVLNAACKKFNVENPFKTRKKYMAQGDSFIKALFKSFRDRYVFAFRLIFTYSQMAERSNRHVENKTETEFPWWLMDDDKEDF